MRISNGIMKFHWKVEISIAVWSNQCLLFASYDLLFDASGSISVSLRNEIWSASQFDGEYIQDMRMPPSFPKTMDRSQVSFRKMSSHRALEKTINKTTDYFRGASCFNSWQPREPRLYLQPNGALIIQKLYNYWKKKIVRT